MEETFVLVSGISISHREIALRLRQAEEAGDMKRYYALLRIPAEDVAVITLPIITEFRFPGTLIIKYPGPEHEDIPDLSTLSLVTRQTSQNYRELEYQKSGLSNKLRRANNKYKRRNKNRG